MRLRTVLGAVGLALLLTLLPGTLAGAEYRGTDMWSNLVPPGPGGMADKHPLSYFQLDYHVKGVTASLTGGVDTNDADYKIIHVFANVIFTILIFMMRVAISAFDWAFNIDVIGGRHGALTPIGRATEDLWTTTFMPFLKTAVLCLGGWFIYKMVGRRFSEAGVGLLRAVILSAIALAIIFNSGSTFGTASGLANQLSGSIASSTTGANGGVDVSDRIFQTFVYKPWVVLQFGGLEHCVDWSRKDSDGFPKQANASTPKGSRECRNNVVAENGKGGYAQRFLRYPPGSKARAREYEALSKGKIPEDESQAGVEDCPRGDCSLTDSERPEPKEIEAQFAGYRLDKADAPAADMMQAQGAFQRLGFVFLLGIGILGAIGLLGMICLASLFAQIGFLAVLAALPIAAIAAIFPATHGFVFSLAKWGGRFLIAKVMYAVLLAIVLGVSAGLMAFGEVMGYLPAFIFQGVLFGGLFLKRRALVEQFTSRRDYSKMENKTKSFVAGTAAAAVGVAAAPVAAAGAVAAAGKKRLDNIDEQRQQRHAPKPSSAENSSAPRPDSTSPPASAGREYSPNPISEDKQAPASAPSADAATIDVAKSPETTQMKGEVPVSTRSFQDDYEKARAELAQDQPVRTPAAAPPPGNGNVGHVDSFAEALKQERAKASSKS